MHITQFWRYLFNDDFFPKKNHAISEFLLIFDLRKVEVGVALYVCKNRYIYIHDHTVTY